MQLAALPLLLALGAGPVFPASVDVDGRALARNGVGKRLATIFNIEVYAAALYVEKTSPRADVLLRRDQAWRLVMRFSRDVDGERLKASLRDAFARNGLEKERAKIAKLTGAVTGVKKGDEVFITYVPGRGTEVRWGGRVGEPIPGASFARGLLRCWIGERPPNPELKAGLLGG